MLRIVFATMIGLIVTGCAANGHMDGFRPDRVALTGFVGKAEFGGTTKYDLINMKDSKANSDTLEAILDDRVNEGTVIEAEDIVKLEVIKADGTPAMQDFSAYMGPASEGASAKVRISGSPSNVELYFGWVYLVGHGPHTSSNRVAAGALGSKLLLQIDEVANRHRVFLIETSAAGAFARSLLTSDKVDPWTTPGTYIEVDAGGYITGPTPYTGDLLTAVQEAHKIASAN